MRKFFRYALRSSEGLREYLMLLGSVLGACFLINLILLIVLVANNYYEKAMMSLYEIVGAVAAGFGCASLADRLLRTSVSFGVSRKTYLRGMLCVLPVFALITTVMIQLALFLTDGIFRLAGYRLLYVANRIYNNESNYDPRMLVLNLTVIFCLCIAAYALALLYAGCKSRFNRIVGVIAVSICFRIGYSWIRGDFISYYYCHFRDCFYPDQSGVFLQIILDICYFMKFMTILSPIWGLLFYAVFATLTKHSAVCGREQGGKI